jgi:hypothetical protein
MHAQLASSSTGSIGRRSKKVLINRGHVQSIVATGPISLRILYCVPYPAYQNVMAAHAPVSSLENSIQLKRVLYSACIGDRCSFPEVPETAFQAWQKQFCTREALEDSQVMGQEKLTVYLIGGSQRFCGIPRLLSSLYLA